MKSIGTVLRCAALSALTMAGCSVDVPDETAGRALPDLISARAVGRHYVEATFDGTVGSEAEEPTRYVITASDGSSLGVRAATVVAPERTRVMLRTDAQTPVTYRLMLVEEVTPAGSSPAGGVSFSGSMLEEVSVQTAVSLGNTALLVMVTGWADATFGADDFYIEGLDVVSVSADSTDVGNWILTTAPQADRDYTLELVGLGGASSAVIDPLRGHATFRGIGEDDQRPPTVRRVTSLSATAALVEFSESVQIRGGNLKTVFQVSPRGTALSLDIAQAELRFHDTHVLLTTAPQASGVEYELRINGNRRSDITDLAGNPFAEPSDAAAMTFIRSAASPVLVGDVEPRLVGAISTGNTSVQVAFNKAMGDRALDPTNYLIVTNNVNPEAGGLTVIGVRFLTTDRTENGPIDRSRIELTTLSQTTVEYKLTVIGVFDVDGKALGPARLTSDADGLVMVGGNQTTFAGTGASGLLADTDGDGLLDTEEQLGWVVTVVLVQRPGMEPEVVVREVTSDPTNPDTDGDGLNDAQESQFKSDPRDLDTDDDQVLDFDEVLVWGTRLTDQDSDDDTISDSRELNVYKTSPRLADTDGDGLADNEEVVVSNRDPRVADLPDPGIEIGQVALRLDTRFSYTNTQGESTSVAKSTSSTLAQSSTRTYTTSDSTTNQLAVQAGAEGGYQNATGYFKASFSASYTRGNTFTATQSSSEQTQEQYQESLSVDVTRDVTQAITRSVEGASVELLVTVNNRGDIPFTIRNLEITGLLQDPFDRSSFLPVATLLPASELEGGGPLDVALGPFIPDRGPFIFKNSEVFPSLVEDLMKNPRGLIFKVANFDIEDEEGRNFAFITQDVNDRTVSLFFDFGTGEVDRFRVSAHSPLDINACDPSSTNSGAFCTRDADCPGGTCDFGDGRPVGITMGFALREILGLKKNEPVNAITVGPNGCGETSAVGDDEQVVVPDCPPVAVGGTIIEPGPNGILDTIPMGDDHRDLTTGRTIVDGGDGCAHTRFARDDIQVVPGGCETAAPDGIMVRPGPDGLFQTTPAGDDELATVTGYGTERIGICDGNTSAMITPGSDQDLNTVLAGDDIIVAGNILPGPNGIVESAPRGDDVLEGPGLDCATDGDCPGPGLCKTVERLTRFKAVKNISAESRFWIVVSDLDVSADTDFDDLLLRSGDAVSVAYVQDKDADGLLAREEFLYGTSDQDDNSDGCPDRDRAPANCDPLVFDFDTISDFEEVREGWNIAVEGQRGYFAFPNPIQPDTDADRLFDDEERTLGTDPAKRDTDDDEISDFDEVRGFDIFDRNDVLVRKVLPYQSARIVPGANGLLDTAPVPDDVAGTDPNGRPIITAGPNGVLDSRPEEDDELEAAKVILDGGNGVSETTASGDDVQVGPAPTVESNVIVTFLDFDPNGNACDEFGPGEFAFDLRVNKNQDTPIGTLMQSATVDPFTPHDFDDGNEFSAILAPGDSISIFGTIRELDGICGADSRRAVIEPGEVIVEPRLGGNGTADTEVPVDANGVAQTDDVQEVPFGSSVEPGQVIISPGANGVLDTAPGGDDDRPVGNGLADTLATGDDLQEHELLSPVSPGDVIVSCGPDGEPDMVMSPGVPGFCAAAMGQPRRAPFACAPVITAGINGIAESFATGDDEQLVPAGIPAAGSPVIGPGPNGVIDSMVANNLIVDGGNATADTTAAGDDLQVVAVGTMMLPPGSVIVGPGPNGVLDTTPAGDDYIADDQLVDAFVPPDLDCSICPLGECVVNCALCPTGTCQGGDDVLFVASPGRSCEDGFCPCGTCVSTTGIREWQFTDSFPLSELGSGRIVEFTDGPDCFAQSVLRVRIAVERGDSVPPGAVVVRSGPNGELDTQPGGDDIVGAVHLTFYATNPRNRDTDGDSLFDGAESVLGANPNDALDASKFRDNDLDGLANIEETEGWFVGFADAFGLRCRTASGTFIPVDDESNPPDECEIITSDPFEPDTDFDGLPDLLERLIYSDPRSDDTDEDGLLDFDEFDPGSPFSVSIRTFREFQRRCAEAERCSFSPVDDPHGTSVVLADTDEDGRTDREELFETWVIFPCTTGGGQLPIEVSSDPLTPDADNDGVLDGDELTQKTDPNNPDTDGDGMVDNPMVDPDPLGCGKIVTVSFANYTAPDDCDGFLLGSGEFQFRLSIKKPDGRPVNFNEDRSGLEEGVPHNFRSNSVTFRMSQGQSFKINGKVTETDCGNPPNFFECGITTLCCDNDDIWDFRADDRARVVNFNDLPLPSDEIIIGPSPGHVNNNCFTGHHLRVSITARDG